MFLPSSQQFSNREAVRFCCRRGRIRVLAQAIVGIPLVLWIIFVGYVVQFQVRAEYLKKFSIQKAGAREHLEYWIPAEQMSEFNQNILGKIEIIAEFR